MENRFQEKFLLRNEKTLIIFPFAKCKWRIIHYDPKEVGLCAVCHAVQLF